MTFTKEVFPDALYVVLTSDFYEGRLLDFKQQAPVTQRWRYPQSLRKTVCIFRAQHPGGNRKAELQADIPRKPLE